MHVHALQKPFIEYMVFCVLSSSIIVHVWAICMAIIIGFNQFVDHQNLGKAMGESRIGGSRNF